MKRRRNRDVTVFGVSFLDVLANTIGGLAFLLVLAVLAVGASVGYVRPIINTEQLPAGYANQEYEAWLSAREGLGKYRWSFGEGERPRGIVLDSLTGRLSGVLQLDADDRREFEFEVEARSTASEGDGDELATRRFVLEVQPEAPVFTTPLRIVTDSVLPDAFRNARYPLVFAAEGGQPPYGWTAERLPPGLDIDPEGSITGAPERVGQYAFDVSVSTGRGEIVIQTVSLSVSELHPPPPPVPPLLVVTEDMPDAVAERQYGVWLAAEGGTPPYAWSVVSPPVPWLRVEDRGAHATGTPGLGAIGRSTLRWQVTDAAGQTARSEPLALTVLPPADEEPPPLVIKTSQLPDARVEQPYGVVLAVEGGFPPYQWTWSGSSNALGVAFDGQGGGFLGTPSEVGRVAGIVNVSDRGGATVSADLALTVNPALTPVAILTESAPRGREGEGYDFALAAVGGFPPYSWRVVAGTLPAGLALDSSGIVRGTPTTAGAYDVEIAVADAAGQSAPVASSLPFEILTRRGTRKLVITTEAIPTLLVGTEAAVTLASEGGTEPHLWSVDSLPGGLGLDGSRILGTPAGAGRRSLQITVRDAVGQSATTTVPLTVRRVSPFWLAALLALLVAALLVLLFWLARQRAKQKPEPLRIQTDTLPNARASCDYAVQLACIGGAPPYAWKVVAGSLPPGMELHEEGRLSGRPFEGVGVDETKDVPFTVRVDDGLGNHATQVL